jgi:ATP-dependent protease ClpP protease subunit
MPPWIDVPQAPGARRAAQAQARTTTAEAAPRWYSIRNAADPDEAELLLYDAIGGWFGIYADELIDELRGITAPNLRVRVNSPGGSVFEGIAIANALRAHPANVTVQVDGLAASIASVIAMAGDRIEMAPNSMLMIHEASGVCMGDAAEMDKMSEVLGMISANIANAYAARTGGDPADWRAAMQAETWYLPDAAVEAGLADVALSAVPVSPGTEDEPDEDEPSEDDLAARMHARFDLAAYGYTGPPKTEGPKPGPPKAKTDESAVPTLVISIADLLDEDTVTALRTAVRERGAAAAAEFGGTVADVPAQPVGTGQAGTPAAPEPTNEAPVEPTWADLTASLTAPKPDPWAAALARLTTIPASSSATES